MHEREYTNRYAAAEVTVTDREGLLLRIFAGGERFLQQARHALATGDLLTFAEKLSRSQAIIGELVGTLDHEAGGAIAANLGRLYEFMLFHLTEANAHRSIERLDEVIRIFGTIAGAYRTILTERPVETPAAS